MKRFFCLLALVASPVLAQTPYPFPSGSPVPNTYPSPPPPSTNSFNCPGILAQIQALDLQHTKLILVQMQILELEKKIEETYKLVSPLEKKREELEDKRLSTDGLTEAETQELNMILGIMGIYASLIRDYTNQLTFLRNQYPDIMNQINSIMQWRSMLQSMYDTNCR